MSDVRDEVFALLDEYAAGPTPTPPSAEVITSGIRLRRRRRLALAGTAFAVAILVAAGSIVAATRPAGSTHHNPAGPLAQPTAEQLAHGHWTRIPKAPISLCDPIPVSDGSGVIVVEYGFRPCKPAAARYDPSTNSWTQLSAPPADLGQGSPLAWGGGRLVGIARSTGTTVEWSEADDRWTQAQTLPGPPPSPADPGPVALTWTGRAFDAISLEGGVAHTFSLDASGAWSTLADLSATNGQTIVDASMTSDHGTIYAIASAGFIHDRNLEGVGSNLYRLASGRWELLDRSVLASLPSSPLPLSQLSMTSVDDRLLVAGSRCPAFGPVCQGGYDAAATLIRLAPLLTESALRPPGVDSMPPASEVTAGGESLYASYVDGVGGLEGRDRFPTGEIYDLATRSWRRAPNNGAVQGDSATWTSGGVVLISPTHDLGDGRTTSWLLAPGP